MLKRIVTPGDTDVGQAANAAAWAAYLPVEVQDPAPHFMDKIDLGVRGTDASLHIGPWARGHVTTIDACRTLGKPLKTVGSPHADDPADVVAFLERHEVGSLYVLGPMLYRNPCVYEFAARFLTRLFSEVATPWASHDA